MIKASERRLLVLKLEKILHQRVEKEDWDKGGSSLYGGRTAAEDDSFIGGRESKQSSEYADAGEFWVIGRKREKV